MIELYGAKIETLHRDNLHYIDNLGDSFAAVWLDDHFHKAGRPTLECWTTLAYLAALYPEYHFGTLVLSQSFRNPAMLAKMMSTLQHISDGRYIAGVGAGWLKDEYLAYGFEYPPTKIRIEQLEEAVQILRLMWAQSPSTFKGKYYSIDKAESEPLPSPPPPLLIGGGGEKYTLKVVAKYADWMNLTFADENTFSHKLQVLRKHCDDVGRDYSAIKKSLWQYVWVTREGTKPKPISGDRYVISGTPEQVGEILRRFTELGVEHFMLRFLDFPSLEGLELFKEEVYPYL
jgi:alkanesulfonate monooxygenase SsuD/methylene tetrahydromethanopterin reductase-like flavin-dependent oxidoreductase (luciferase family)